MSWGHPDVKPERPQLASPWWEEAAMSYVQMSEPLTLCPKAKPIYHPWNPWSHLLCGDHLVITLMHSADTVWHPIWPSFVSRNPPPPTHTRREQVIDFKAKTKTTNLKVLILIQWARQLPMRLLGWVCDKSKDFLHLCGSYLLTWQSRMTLGTLNTI